MMKFFYTLHTDAPFEVARDVAVDIATKHGHAAYLSEAKGTDESAAHAAAAAKSIEEFGRNLHKRQRWTLLQWWLAFIALTGSPFVFRYLPGVSGLQGYGIGWIVAVTLIHRPWEWR